MIFFTGIYRTNQIHRVERAFVSIRSLRGRRSDFAANDWLLDSGGFAEVIEHGGYQHSAEDYLQEVDRFARCGRLLGAFAQDWACAPAALARTGLSIQEHQIRTIDRWAEISGRAAVPILAVLQGASPADYRAHALLYGSALEPGAWVGVGSLVRLSRSADAIADVLAAILDERPDLRLHGMGLKTSALSDERVWSRLHSADSMAWSWAARREGRGSNDWREAKRFEERMKRAARQLSLF